MIAKNKLKRLSNDVKRYLFIACLATITVLSILPDSAERGYEMPHLTESGFFMHLFAYFTASFLGYSAFKSKRHLAVFLIFFSSALEGLQLFISYRTFNYWDMVANFSGIILLFATAAIVSRLNQNHHIEEKRSA